MDQECWVGFGGVRQPTIGLGNLGAEYFTVASHLQYRVADLVKGRGLACREGLVVVGGLGPRCFFPRCLAPPFSLSWRLENVWGR